MTRSAVSTPRSDRKDHTLDEIDRGLVHALQLDGRASFTLVADVLGTSLQTVRRRYARLQETVGLRVVGLSDAARAGQQQWLVRLTTTTGAARAVARALARRSDTSWVRLASGGTEIIAVVTSTDSGNAHALLLRDVPRTAGVTAVSAHCLLRTYVGGAAYWTGRTQALSARQQRRIRAGVPTAGTVAATGPSPRTTEEDRLLLAALTRDGRLPFATLARDSGMSASTAARRVDALRARRRLFFDVELDDRAFGVVAATMLWMSVVPSRLKAVAESLAEHDELAFVAATTGQTNLVAQALSRDLASLFDYLTDRVGSIEGITSLESVPILETLKAGAPARGTFGP